MSASYDRIFLFGDSITQDSFSQDQGTSFSAALQAAYIRRLDVVNRGFSGYTSRQALQILPAVIPSPKEARIRLMTVFFGANDASLPSAPGNQHIPLIEYKLNLEKIITHPKIVAHRPRIMLITPPPVNEHLWWPRDQSNGHARVSRVAETTKEYAEAVCDVGKKLNVPVVNLWRSFMKMTDFDVDAWEVGDPIPGSLKIPQNDALAELMYDGLHFSPMGYSILYQEVMRLIESQWPDQMPTELPMVFPSWNDLEAWQSWERGSSSTASLQKT